jgi:hypothetical protein
MTAARRASGLTERLASATATLKQVPDARPGQCAPSAA